MLANVPSNAVKITYKATNGKLGTYYVWPHDSKLSGRQGWYWSAMGNTGESLTATEAAQAAKQWIRNNDTGAESRRN